LRNQMGQQAVQYAKSYAWEHIAQRLVSVYNDLLKETPVDLNVETPNN